MSAAFAPASSPSQRSAPTALSRRKARRPAPNRRRATGPVRRRECPRAQSLPSAHSKRTAVPVGRDRVRRTQRYYPLLFMRQNAARARTSGRGQTPSSCSRVGFGGDGKSGVVAALPRRCSQLTRNQVQLPNALPMRGLRHCRDAEGGAQWCTMRCTERPVECCDSNYTLLLHDRRSGS